MKIKINEANISLDMAGEGLPLLFIHGFPLSRKIWEPQIAGLAPHAEIIAPDLRGHGDTDSSPGPYTVDVYAKDCVDLMDNLGISQPMVVCGLSMGGYVALALYRNHPERVSGLILTATRAGADSLEAKLNREKAIATAQTLGSKAIADAMITKMFAPSTYVDQPELVQSIHNTMKNTSIEGIVGALYAMKNRPDSTPLLASIKIPVLIIHGDHDQLIPMSEVQIMQSQLPDAKLVIIKNAGHLLNLEQPNEFNEAIYEFLQTT